MTSPKYPRSYAAGAAMLHDGRVQSMMVHDDLELAFGWHSVLVVFRNTAIVQWRVDGTSLILTAATGIALASEETVGHIRRFLPKGWHVKLNRAGQMLLHCPDGQTRMGNIQQIVMQPSSSDVDGQ